MVERAALRLGGLRRRPEFGAALALLLLLAADAFLFPGFLAIERGADGLRGTPLSILERSSPVALCALGQTLVIATGGIDLSVGATLALAAGLAARLVPAYGPLPAAGLALAAGLAAGLWNALVVARFRVQPIVATLCLLVAGRGLAQLATGGDVLPLTDPLLRRLGEGHVLGLPVAGLLVPLAFAATALLVRRTALGGLLVACGAGPRAARAAGVPVRPVLAAAYGLAGLAAAAAGLVALADDGAADAGTQGLYLELDAILAVVLGGTALSGGRFTLLGTWLGALIVQTATVTVYRLRVGGESLPPEWNLVVKALLVLAVVLARAAAARVRAAAPAPGGSR